MLLGTQNDTGSFEWEKVTNDISPDESAPKNHDMFNIEKNEISTFTRWNYSETKAQGK